MIYLQDPDVTLYHGDALEVLGTLPSESVHCCVTSPPFYGLRDYGTGRWEGGLDPDCDHLPAGARRGVERRSSTLEGGVATITAQEAGTHGRQQECVRCAARRIDEQIGLEETPSAWVERLVEVFREVRRVLRSDGTLWLEVGDSYAGGATGRNDQDIGIRNRGGGYGLQNFPKAKARLVPKGLKSKDLIGAPWMLAFALRADGWYLRSDIIWARPNPMPESVVDRVTKSHSYVFMLAKSARYYWDAEAIREPHSPDGRTVTRVVGQDGSIQHRDGERWPGTGRNSRSVWVIPTQPYPEAHFATFPEELARRCIAAGTSERGCCPECGAPWVRAVDVQQTPDKGGGTVADRQFAADPRDSGKVRGWGEQRTRREVETLGWHPTCIGADGTHGCESPYAVPCTILDPFVGSGTVPYVARKLGRRAIGIDLNVEYLKLAAERTAQQSVFA